MQFVSIVQKSLWRGVNKNGVSNFLRSIGHFFFVRSNCWGPVTSENKCVWAPKTLHYAKFWAQNATKTSAGNIPESLSNLLLRDNCRLSQRLLNNAKQFADLGGFCEFSLVFEEKHSEFTKTPQIREAACESAFLWFGLPGRLLKRCFVV